MKKLFIVLTLFLLSVFTLVGCTDKESEPIDYGSVIYHELSEVAALEARKCFDFFWETQNTDEESYGIGLIPDRYPNNGSASIASVGFGLTAFPIGVENGWVTYEEAYERSLMTLREMSTLERKEGFYYHFYNYSNGGPSNSEISCIDTAIFICGALFAGQYFGGEVQTLAQTLYEDVNWPWYVNPNTNQFYMTYIPSKNKHDGKWDYYGEQLMMYFLGAGSPTHPIGKEVYDAFKKQAGYYGDYKVYYSWFGSIFTYQFSHAWIDFRNIEDANGINWYDNSVQATYAHQQFCIDNAYSEENSNGYKTFSNLSWGLTACDYPGEGGYNGFFGASPRGHQVTASTPQKERNDGTIALCGAIGSLPFAPDIVLPTMDYYYNTLDGKLFGGYGFVDSYNLENNRTWIAKDVIGIDKGISLLMIENYRSELVWQVFMDCEFMDRAIKNLGFTETK